MSTYRERERKFVVPDGFHVAAALGSRLPGTELDTGSAHSVVSAYLDTAERDLLRRGVTLRHRTSAHENGWQLKVPVDGSNGVERDEIRVASDSDAVPEEIGRLVKGLTQGRPLGHVARIVTTRTAHTLRDGGAVLAEIDDDVVRATAMGEIAVATRWREIEVELAPTTDRARLEQIGAALVAAGAESAAYGSKLGRALGDGAAPAAIPAGEPLLRYLAEQYEAILTGDLALRRGASSVHDTRVAVRRLRSTLRVFGSHLAAGARDALDTELRWYAGVLGEIRDAEVLLEHVVELVDRLPDELVLGDIKAQLAGTLGSAYQRDRAGLAAVLDDERYLTLLATLDAWIAAGPVRTPKPSALRRSAAKARSKAVRRLREALAGDDAALHRARKAAKRARYAAELLVATGDPKAAKAVRHFKTLQEHLGAHQDAVVATAVLRDLAAREGPEPGHNGFTYGVLHERERARQEATRAEAEHWLERRGAAYS